MACSGIQNRKKMFVELERLPFFFFFIIIITQVLTDPNNYMSANGRRLAVLTCMSVGKYRFFYLPVPTFLYREMFLFYI